MTQTKTKNQTQAPVQPPPIQEPEIEMDMFGEGADLLDQQLEVFGFRRVQHMNENHSYHKGSSIEDGGYAIKNEDASAPAIGPTETIKHLGGKTTQMAVAKDIEIQFVGFSSRYWTVEYDDVVVPGKRVSLIVSEYIAPENLPGDKPKCRMGISVFVVLRADTERRLYEIPFKGFTVEGATKCINDIKGLTAEFAQKIGKRVHPFAFWMKLGLVPPDQTLMVGKEEQSAVNPPAWVAVDEPLEKRLVSKEDYLHAIELRRELDAFLATGRYKGIRNDQQQLAAPAGANAPALAAPRGN